MLELKEDLLQFAWQHRLLKPVPLKSVSGKEIKVLKQGELNRDSGPDFFNARIVVDGLTLAGNLEVHLKSSDWLKHGHVNDKNYDNIILHVVYENDVLLQQNTKNNVEVLEIKSLLPDDFISGYKQLLQSKNEIACSSNLNTVDDFKFSAWIERMYMERLEHKTEYIEDLFNTYKGDYAQTFYTVLLRNFGFKVNALPFELLAKQLPLNILLRHSDNLLQLEALLFGCSGLLEDNFKDKYAHTLQNEFEHLQRKYHLVPLKKEIFKFSRLRPANFPSLRLAQLAAIMHSKAELFSSPHRFTEYNQIYSLLKTQTGAYWKNHYRFDGNPTNHEVGLGHDSVENIIINTFCNYLFFYFRKTGSPDFAKVPLGLAMACGFEKNKKTRLYAAKAHLMKSAADGQGLVHLYDNYCKGKQCLRCGVGLSILK